MSTEQRLDGLPELLDGSLTSEGMRVDLQAADRLDQECGAGEQQTKVNVLEKRVSTQPMIHESADQDRRQNTWQRQQVIVGDRAYPQPSHPITSHADQAGG